MPDKDFKIRFSAQQDGTFGSTVTKVQRDLAAVGDIAKGVATSLTGGILGGGAVGVILSVIDRISGLIRETASLASKAQDISVDYASAKGIKGRASYIGASPETVFSGIENAGQAVVEFEANRLAFVKAFGELGISLKEVRDLKPQETFYRIADAIQATQYNGRTKLAIQTLLGSAASELTPFAIKSGSRAFKPMEGVEFTMAALASLVPGGAILKMGSDVALGAAGAVARFKGGVDGTGNPFKGDVKPVSTFEVENAERSAKLAEQNRFRAAEIARSQLPVEQQINDVLAQRVQIERDLASAPSDLRRQQLIGRLLDADQSLATLRARQLGTGTPDIKGANIQRNLDDLSRAGFFTNGSPVALGNIQADQLKELKEITAQLRKAPSETAKAL